ncbi:hypothetical protein [Bradyrhizobium sp. WSM471]|uniref:hypothetical protein n=1 Tax=Bradyrhizobium sp. WSM471 TaxID=319017 RepID=UPI00024D21C0|nr:MULTISPECIES: hypothetical protein [Bradyrhizobium]EHR01335.1 hypothetical protein Bra471DRAFT_02042 [Bradyrhizobium sp. WSM471]UFW43394.1 hypothetical protein BcanWSM471_10040 [Bradyrhizobium canariense]
MRAIESIVSAYLRLRDIKALSSLKEKRLQILASADGGDPFFAGLRGQCLEELSVIEHGISKYEAQGSSLPKNKAADQAAAAVEAFEGGAAAGYKVFGPIDVDPSECDDDAKMGREESDLSLLPSVMRPLPPDIYINFTTGQGWKKAGPVVVDASSMIEFGQNTEGRLINSRDVWSEGEFCSAISSDQGISIWAAGTNVVSNNSLQGAVEGCPGVLPKNWAIQSAPLGLVRTITLGTTDGIEWIEINWRGTTTSAGSFQVVPETVDRKSIAATDGEVWTNSMYFQVTQDDPSITGLNLDIWQYDDSVRSAFVGINGTSVYSERLVWSRKVCVTTLKAGAATAWIQPMIRSTNPLPMGTALDFSMRLGWPQLERRDFPTPAIRTDGRSASRVPAICELILSGLDSFGRCFSVYAQGRPRTPSTNGEVQPLLYLLVGGGGALDLRRDALVGTPSLEVISEVSRTISPPGSSAWAPDSKGKLAAAFSPRSQAISFDGALGHAESLEMPDGPFRVLIGSDGTGCWWNGDIQEIAIWLEECVPDNILQSLTI